MRQQRMGNPACRSGFPPEMYGLWASDHGSPQDGGEKHKKSSKKGKIMLYSLKKVC